MLYLQLPHLHETKNPFLEPQAERPRPIPVAQTFPRDFFTLHSYHLSGWPGCPLSPQCFHAVGVYKEAAAEREGVKNHLNH